MFAFMGRLARRRQKLAFTEQSAANALIEIHQIVDHVSAQVEGQTVTKAF